MNLYYNHINVSVRAVVQHGKLYKIINDTNNQFYIVLQKIPKWRLQVEGASKINSQNSIKYCINVRFVTLVVLHK